MQEELEEQISKLKKLNIPIVVEGIKDKKTLESLGIKNIIPINSKPLFKVIESLLNEKEIIILTDLDREGKKLYGKLNSWFCRFGVKVNNKFRNFLLKNTKLRQIEGLATYKNEKR